MSERSFPQYLSAPFQILWFETDELGVMSLFYCLATVYGSFSWLFLFIGPMVYMNIKKRYPKGFLKHSFYFIGFTRMKHYPTFFESYFIE